MKTILFLSFIFFILFLNAQNNHDHNHDTKISDAREIWGDFSSGELIKTSECKWKNSPFGKKVFKRGKLKESFSYLDSIDIYNIVYNSDGLMITGFMVRPKNPGNYPCIIYNRGGNRDFGALLVYNAIVQMGIMAAEGYVVIASNYRGNSNSEGKEEFGGADSRDVLNLIPALNQIEFADTSRIGMFGISRGAMMTYLAMKKNCKIKTAITLGGMNDLFIMKEKRPDMETHVYKQIIPNYKDSLDALLKDRSATYWANELCSSANLLMMHGSADKACDISMAQTFHDQLKKVNYPHVFVEFNKDNHGCKKHRKEVLNLTMEWFDKYLKKGEVFNEKSSYIFVK